MRRSTAVGSGILSLFGSAGLALAQNSGSGAAVQVGVRGVVSHSYTQTNFSSVLSGFSGTLAGKYKLAGRWAESPSSQCGLTGSNPMVEEYEECLNFTWTGSAPDTESLSGDQETLGISFFDCISNSYPVSAQITGTIGPYSSGISWDASGVNRTDANVQCEDITTICSVDTAANLCKFASYEWSHTNLDNDPDASDGFVKFSPEFALWALGYGATSGLVECTEGGSITALSLGASKMGRISFPFRIEGPPLPGSGTPYVREFTVLVEIRASATSGGGYSSTLTYSTIPTTLSNDRYVEFSLGSPITSAGSLGVCSTIDSPATPGYFKIHFGKSSGTSETWKVILRPKGVVTPQSSGDVAGGGAARSCGRTCPLAGDAPDGKTDIMDFRALKAAIGATSTDCEYLPFADLDGDGTVESGEVSSLICGQMADFNNDQFVDFNDYDAFVAAYTVGGCDADVNGDDFVDGFDYDDYVALFEVGSPCEDPYIDPIICEEECEE